MQVPILVLLVLLLNVPGFSQMARSSKSSEFIYNVFSHNEPFLLKVWVQRGEELLLTKDYDLKYSLQQPEIIENLTLSLDNFTDNITLYTSLFKLSPTFA